MKVSIITMQFPSPSETFASNDIRIMKSLGVDINVYSMKPKPKDHIKLVKDRSLSSISIDHNSMLKNFIGFCLFFLHPILLLKLLKYILFTNNRTLLNYLKLLLLLPSTFYIFNKIKKNPPNVVHLFWGHYPSLV